MPRQLLPVKRLLTILVICGRISTGVADESNGKKQAIPDAIVQMIQSASAVNVSIVQSQHTENGITQIQSISYPGGTDANQIQALVKLLTQPGNFSENAAKIATLYYFVDISHERDFAIISIGKEGISVQMGKKTVFQESFSAIGAHRVIDWAAAASKPRDIPPAWNPEPMPEASPLKLYPADNLMKILLNGEHD